MDIENHQEIRDHFVELRDALKRHGIDAQRLADICGVKRQTIYQYGFSVSARGARVIPAPSLDKLRFVLRDEVEVRIAEDRELAYRNPA